MTAIPATTYTSRVLVDGTLALTLHIEPNDRLAAQTLFSGPGTPVALAAIRSASQRQQPEPDEPKPKGGMWSQWLALRCKEAPFQAFLGVTTEASAADRVREMCGVSSRADIDNDEHAKHLFDVAIRRPWLERSQETA